MLHLPTQTSDSCAGPCLPFRETIILPRLTLGECAPFIFRTFSTTAKLVLCMRILLGRLHMLTHGIWSSTQSQCAPCALPALPCKATSTSYPKQTSAAGGLMTVKPKTHGYHGREWSTHARQRSRSFLAWCPDPHSSSPFVRLIASSVCLSLEPGYNSEVWIGHARHCRPKHTHAIEYVHCPITFDGGLRVDVMVGRGAVLPIVVLD